MKCYPLVLDRMILAWITIGGDVVNKSLDELLVKSSREGLTTEERQTAMWLISELRESPKEHCTECKKHGWTNNAVGKYKLCSSHLIWSIRGSASV